MATAIDKIKADLLKAKEKLVKKSNDIGYEIEAINVALKSLDDVTKPTDVEE